MATHNFFKSQVNMVLIALLFAVVIPVWADNSAQFQQGVAAYQAGNYNQAFRLLQPLAQQGNTMAQNNLGVMYKNGQGVAQNDKQAVAWYQKAANQGHALAQHNLGVMYYLGRGVVQNVQQAKTWWQKVVAQPDTAGNAEAKALSRESLQVLRSKGIR